MAEVTILVCDPCARRDRQTAATETLRVTVEDRPLRIDVCEEHAGEFRRVLDTLLAVGSEEPPATKSHRRGPRASPDLVNAPGATGCPVCFKLLSTPGNMGHHLRKIHLRKPEEFTTEERTAATWRARQQLGQETAP